MPEGGDLTISMSYDQKDDFITIIFENTGPGISEEDMGKIFEPFYTTKPEGEGSGLGLDISKQIISKHNGKIDYVNTHRGVKFTIVLPRETSDSNPSLVDI